MESETGTRINSDGVEIVTRPSFSERLGRAAEQMKSGEEIDFGIAESSNNGTSNDTSTVSDAQEPSEAAIESMSYTSPVVKEVVAPAPPVAREKSNYRKLEEGLEIANRHLEDYKTRFERVKDYDEIRSRAEAAEARLQEIEPKFVESENWRAQHNILRSDEYDARIAAPRRQIAEVIKNEFRTEGIDEDLWERAQSVQSRYELERLAEENIQSTLLRSQFYDLYFKDLELRNAEHAALAAPLQWIESQRQEENMRRESIRAEQNRALDTVWEQGILQARDMNDKLGDNRIVELSYIQGNKDHNEKVVKPILDLANKNAKVELQDMILSGRPVNAQVAATVVYKWQQAVAAQNAHQDRLRWFNKYKETQKALDDLRTKHDKLLNRASPVPSSNGNAPSGEARVTGESMAERIRSFAEQHKTER